MDLNNNKITKLNDRDICFNDRDIIPHKQAFVVQAYDVYSSPISERVLRKLQRAADQMNMISMDDWTSSFQWLFND